jgi:hypothetical protein
MPKPTVVKKEVKQMLKKITKTTPMLLLTSRDKLRNTCSKSKTRSRRSAKILLQKNSDSKRPDLHS